MNKRSLAMIPGMVLFCLAGCACSRYTVATTQRTGNLRAYAGPPLPRDSIGYLACATGDLEVAQIDGVSVKQMIDRTGYVGNFNYVELRPGEHDVLVKGSTFHTVHRRFHVNLTVDISSYTFSMMGEMKIRFPVEPGHVYVIDYKTMKKQSPEKASSFGHVLAIFIKDVLIRHEVCRVETELKKVKCSCKDI